MIHGLETGIGRQVAGRRGEAAPQVLGAPDEGDAAVVRDIEPLVPVRRPGIGAGQASGQVRTRRIRQCPQPERAIDMHPRVMPLGPLQDGRERIKPTGVDLARLGTDHHRAGYVLGQAFSAHPPLIIGRDPAHPIPAESDQAQGLEHRRMGLLPDDDRQLGCSEQPVGLHVPADPGQLVIARGGQGGGVGHGRPGHERRTGSGRQAQQLDQPSRHDVMQARGHRRHHRQRRVLIPRRGQPARRHRDRIGAAYDEPEIAAARAGHGGRRSGLVQQGQCRGRVSRHLGQRLVKPGQPGQRGTVRGDRALIDAGQVLPGPCGSTSQQRLDFSTGKQGHDQSLAGERRSAPHARGGREQ